jgi:hypothetical protein
MSVFEPQRDCGDVERVPHFVDTPPTVPVTVPAWEQVEAGRFMPRRVKGSCVGRALG